MLIQPYLDLLKQAIEQTELKMLTDEEMFIPSKAYPDDAGYDLRANLINFPQEPIINLIKVYEQTSTNPFNGLLSMLANLLRVPSERLSLPCIYIDGELFWKPGQAFDEKALINKTAEGSVVLYPKSPRTLTKYLVMSASDKTQERIPTGVCIGLPVMPEPLLSMIRWVPRSGIASKHGLSIANSPGTGDQGYDGEHQIALENRGEHIQVITHGCRIAQMIAEVVLDLGTDLSKYQVVEFSKKRARSAAGFGSSGVK